MQWSLWKEELHFLFIYFWETSLSKIKPQGRKADNNKWGNTLGSTWVTAIALTLLRVFSKNINLQVVRMMFSLKITTYPNIQHIQVIDSPICHQKGLYSLWICAIHEPPQTWDRCFQWRAKYWMSAISLHNYNFKSWKTNSSSQFLYHVTTYLAPTIPRV